MPDLSVATAAERPTLPVDWEVPQPEIKRYCGRCRKMYLGHRDDAFGVISRQGTIHMAESGGDTACGIDATGPNWWWPL